MLLEAKTARTARKRRLSIYFALIATLGVTVFALTNGIERYLSSKSWTITIAGRPATPDERFQMNFVDEITHAAPLGVVATIVFILVYSWAGWLLRRSSLASGFVFGSIFGGIGGVVLSMVVYLCLGGWGPPFIIPSVACGVAIGGSIVTAVQWASHPIQGHCEKCDYNLTGNVSGTCPECGTLIILDK